VVPEILNIIFVLNLAPAAVGEAQHQAKIKTMMSYLFVLPVYALALAAALIAGVVCLFIPKARRFCTYLLASALGSLLGMIVANLTLFLVLSPLLKGTASAPQSVRLSAGFLIEAGAIIGPFVASAAGVILGAGIACALVRNARRRAASGMPTGASRESAPLETL
jgi:hypothetical protein